MEQQQSNSFFPHLSQLRVEQLEMRTVGVEEALAPLLRYIRHFILLYRQS
jgi:hypothetical protein